MNTEHVSVGLHLGEQGPEEFRVVRESIGSTGDATGKETEYNYSYRCCLEKLSSTRIIIPCDITLKLAIYK